MKPRLAIIGTGISGLGLAWFLRNSHDVHLFEADSRPGGHANTVDAKLSTGTLPVDTGFMVFNRVTYPNLVRLFEALEVPCKPTDMSFSVQHLGRNLEFCGSSLAHLFVQRRNLLRPSYYRLLFNINRFNEEALEHLEDPRLENMSLGDYVFWRGYGEDFLQLYLIPMSSAVWSTPPKRMLEFPARSLLRFFHNHGFLGLSTQHPWWTVQGGSREYVQRLIKNLPNPIRLRCPVRSLRRTPNAIELNWDGGSESFDGAVLACHPPASLKILNADATPFERHMLSAFHYQPNVATLHRDTRVMPKRRRAWSSWNYRIAPGPVSKGLEGLDVSTHYWMTRLQDLGAENQAFVSINGGHLAAPETRQLEIDYEHPLFDLAAIKAQKEVEEVNRLALSSTHTYFAGAWQRYGFHEDGLLSAVKLAEQILGRDPWSQA